MARPNRAEPLPVRQGAPDRGRRLDQRDGGEGAHVRHLEAELPVEVRHMDFRIWTSPAMTAPGHWRSLSESMVATVDAVVIAVDNVPNGHASLSFGDQDCISGRVQECVPPPELGDV